MNIHIQKIVKLVANVVQWDVVMSLNHDIYKPNQFSSESDSPRCTAGETISVISKVLGVLQVKPLVIY